MALYECGCGGEAKPGRRFIQGHNSKGKNNPMYGVEPWNKGETKETNKKVKGAGEKIKEIKNEFFATEEGEKSAKKMGKTKKEFFATDKGQEWLDENYRGENHPMYGVHRYGEDAPNYGKIPWNKGLTKDTNESIKRVSEFMTGDNNPAKRPEVGEKISIVNTAKYAKGEMVSWCKGETKDNNVTLKNQSEKQLKNWQDPEFIKMMVNSWYRSGQTRPEKETDGIVQQLYPNEYKFNGNFELGISIGGKIPDFVNVNGKKKAIDVFGDWCHRDDDPQIRIDLFKEYGWDLLVIWQHELEDRDAVIQKILKFHGIKSDYVLTQKTLDTWMDGEDKNENQQT